MEAPNIIYLQISGDEVTWCVDRINDDDVVYVRPEKLVEALIRCKRGYYNMMELELGKVHDRPTDEELEKEIEYINKALSMLEET